MKYEVDIPDTQLAREAIDAIVIKVNDAHERAEIARKKAEELEASKHEASKRPKSEDSVEEKAAEVVDAIVENQDCVENSQVANEPKKRGPKPKTIKEPSTEVTE